MALLAALGATVATCGRVQGGVELATTGDEDPMAAWARGGGAWLTGRPQGAPLGGPAVVAGAMEAAATALRTVARWASVELSVDGPGLLGERAAALGLCRAGATTAGGAGRLLRAADGWVAVNLPRPSDRDLVPAWLGTTTTGWPAVAGTVARCPARDVVERGQLLGLPVAWAVTPREAMADEQGRARDQVWPPRPWVVDTRRPGPPSTPGTPPARTHSPLVVDLSSLWAGPLASRLLADVGARVVKVESHHRPDTIRSHAPRFHDRLNAGKASVVLDFRDPEGVRALRALLAAADIVIEASRPRALDQLGCGPDDLLGNRHDQVWVSITGYGRRGPGRQWAALGDDAGAAGGLAVGHGGRRLFCADAVADPAAGLHAAVAALACWYGGGSHHVDIAMRDVAAGLALQAPDGLVAGPSAVHDRQGWVLEGHRVRPPTLPPTPTSAPPLGGDTTAVLAGVLAGGPVGRPPGGDRPAVVGVRL